MKKKILAGFLAATLAFTAVPYGATDVTDVQAADRKYYTNGVVTDINGYEEICVGDTLAVTASTYLSADNTALTNDRWGFVPDDVVSEDMVEMGNPSSLNIYTPKEDSDTWTYFDGAVPEKAFGQYVKRAYGIFVDENENGNSNRYIVYEYATSKTPVHSLGGTKNISFASNGDGKSVTVYTIFNNKTSATIPSKIKVDGVTYKVTAVGDYANEAAKLKTVTIPSTVKSIGKEAFINAKNLKTVTINGNVTSVGKNAFKGINKKAVIKIKASKKNYTKMVKLIKKAGAPKTVTFKNVK